MQRRASDSAGQERLAPLDFLRGLAILLVVVFHVSIFFKPNELVGRISFYGAHGVQLFFIVSAITMCHMWRIRAGESDRTVRFYIRRIARIGVVFWAFTPLYLLIKWLKSNAATDFHISAVQLISTLSLTHGLSPVTNNAIVPGGWSIGVEVVFYFLFPWIARLCTSNLRTVAWMIAVFAAFNIVLTQVLRTYASDLFPSVSDAETQEFVYQSILTQLPVFFFGMLVYRTTLGGDKADLACMSMVMVSWVAVAFALRSYTILLGRPYFWVVCGLFAGLSAMCLAFDVRQTLVSWIGRMSYSMYIIHFAVIDAARALIPEEWSSGWFRFVFACGVVLLVSCLLSEMSRRFIETKAAPVSSFFIRQRDRIRSHKQSPAKTAE